MSDFDYAADDLCDTPLQVRDWKGAVIITGPNGMALALTADAARASAEALLDAALRARKNAANDDSQGKSGADE